MSFRARIAHCHHCACRPAPPQSLAQSLSTGTCSSEWNEWNVTSCCFNHWNMASYSQMSRIMCVIQIHKKQISIQSNCIWHHLFSTSRTWMEDIQLILRVSGGCWPASLGREGDTETTPILKRRKLEIRLKIWTQSDPRRWRGMKCLSFFSRGVWWKKFVIRLELSRALRVKTWSPKLTWGLTESRNCSSTTAWDIHQGCVNGL